MGCLRRSDGEGFRTRDECDHASGQSGPSSLGRPLRFRDACPVRWDPILATTGTGSGQMPPQLVMKLVA